MGAPGGASLTVKPRFANDLDTVKIQATCMAVRRTPATTGRRQTKRGVEPDSRGAARYHHGDLREALLQSAERLVERDGQVAFTLRACAREAGVSHAAPAHHFRDLGGLNAALAQRAFDRLTEFMDRYAASPPLAGRSRMAAIGLAYIDFALRHPGLYRLMFRCDVSLLAATYPGLRQSADACHGRLLAAVRDSLAARGEAGDAAIRARAALAWSVVHGYASLALEGHFDPDCGREPASHADRLGFAGIVLTGMQGVLGE